MCDVVFDKEEYQLVFALFLFWFSVCNMFLNFVSIGFLKLFSYISSL